MAIKALIDTWQQTHSINVASTFIDVMPEMTDEHNTHLYRIVQESLNNVAQHADASNVHVTLAIDNSELVLSYIMTMADGTSQIIQIQVWGCAQ